MHEVIKVYIRDDKVHATNRDGSHSCEHDEADDDGYVRRNLAGREQAFLYATWDDRKRSFAVHGEAPYQDW